MEHRVGGGGNLEERLIWLERGEGGKRGKGGLVLMWEEGEAHFFPQAGLSFDPPDLRNFRISSSPQHPLRVFSC